MKNFDNLSDLIDFSDEELKKIMATYGGKGGKPEISKICYDILVLRRHESLVNETRERIKKTWWVAFGTWMMAAAAIATAIAGLIQLSRP